MLNRIGFFILLAVGFLWITPAQADIAVKDVRLGQQGGGATRFVLELAETTEFRLFLLDNPRRAVLDLPALHWPESLTTASRGVVKGWRHGQFGDGTRVVLDLAGPITIKASQFLPPTAKGQGARLMIDLIPAASMDVEKSIGELPKAEVTPVSLGNIPIPPPIPQKKYQDVRPMIVIDPGHGGVDPGAISVDGAREKVITLAVAKKLAKALEDSGRYRATLTREKDKFIPLRDRTKIARKRGADLFISLHADSIKGGEARGLSIYTLSDKASDKEAAALADSENRVDQMAGLEAADDDDVATIFISMSQRASMNGSRKFSRLLRRELSQDVRLLERPERAAGFAVLKAPDVPSVLIEMGYLSSRSEAKLLRQDEHQAKIAGAIARAVDGYFSQPESVLEAKAP